MPLSNLVVARETVAFGENSLEVRGLSFLDVTTILTQTKHRASFERVFAIVEERGGLEQMDEDTLLSVAVGLINEMPDFVALLIAYASDEPEQWQNARDKIPLGAQIDLALAVARLTLAEADGLGKLIKQVAAGVRGLPVSALSQAT